MIKYLKKKVGKKDMLLFVKREVVIRRGGEGEGGWENENEKQIFFFGVGNFLLSNKSCRVVTKN